MTEEQEKFLNRITSDLKKLKDSNEPHELSSQFTRVKYGFNFDPDNTLKESRSTQDWLLKIKGFKDYDGWMNSVFKELMERSKTSFQDVIVLKDFYLKYEKNAQESCIENLLELLSYIKANQWIIEEIEKLEVHFQKFLLDLCSLRITTIRSFEELLSKGDKEEHESYNLVMWKLGVDVIYYWNYYHLLVYIEEFLYQNVRDYRNQNLFPSKVQDRPRTETRLNRDAINKIIASIAEKISGKGTSNYTKETITIYLKCYSINQGVSPEKLRDKAIEKSTINEVKKQLENVTNRNLYNWQRKFCEEVDQWKHFTNL